MFIFKCATSFLTIIYFCFGQQLNEPKKSSYDFIVVGAGSGGATVAGLLSKGNVGDVLLLEAGPVPPEKTKIPLYTLTLGSDTSINWVYPIQPNGKSCLGTANQTCNYVSGKTLGGSSQVNGMLYVRGNQIDYDLWESQYGAQGWSYDDVLPFFKKAEGTSISEEFIDTEYHGTDGPLGTSIPNYATPLRDNYLKAAQEQGFQIVDSNGEKQAGFGIIQSTIKNGYRCSTERAYLQPQNSSNNLEIITGALVIKIDISEDKVARGVTYIKNNQTFSVTANREVIVSAGAVKTPQLLMLSGVGPRAHLESFGIKVIADLPVGQNFHDHAGCFGNAYLVNSTGTLSTSEVQNFTNNDNPDFPEVLTGILSSPILMEVVGYAKSTFEKIAGDYNDLQFYFFSTLNGGASGFNKEVQDFFKKYLDKPVFTAFLIMLHPRSKGNVTLNSTDPTVPPILQLNYLSQQEEVDILVTGMKIMNAIAKSEALSKFNPELIGPVPGCEQHKVESDAYFECIARTLTISTLHGVGTCKMGSVNDSTTVVVIFHNKCILLHSTTDI